MARFYGHDTVVSKLLSLGAMQRVPPNMYPLLVTVDNFVDVVGALVIGGRVRVVGGRAMLPQALHFAVGKYRATILRLLLLLEGEGRRSEWANTTNLWGRDLLHYNAGYCSPPSVSVLLEAGADETGHDYCGRRLD